MLPNFLAPIVHAHSGNVDQDGGHYCHTGACEGTYHFHNGGSSGLVMTIIFLMVIYFLIWRSTERRATSDEPIAGNRSPRVENNFKNYTQEVSTNVENSSQDQSSLYRPFNEIEKLIEQARQLQDHSNWHDRSKSYDIWLLGYLLTWLAKDSSEAFKRSLISEDQDLRQTAYDMMKPKVQSFVLKSFTSKNAEPFMWLLERSLMFDQHFTDGIVEAKKDMAHFIDANIIATTISDALEFERKSIDENEIQASEDCSPIVTDEQIVNRDHEDVAGWLTSVTNVTEVETEYSLVNNSLWNDLITLHTEGDEIWNFCTPQSYWDSLCGREGLALVRNKKVIFVVELTIN